MIVGKRRVIKWVPVLGQDFYCKVVLHSIYRCDDLVASFHRKCATWAEIILDIDHDQGLGHFGLPYRLGFRLAIWGRRVYIAAMSNIVVAALYHFTRFDDHEALQGSLQAICESVGIKGSLLLAFEGINGTIAGSRAGIDAVLKHIRALPGCTDLDHKESFTDKMPFLRMKVKLKKEIVTMGQPQVDPTANVGSYVEAEEWNSLIACEDVVVIDTRNDYEVAIGTFVGAVDPKTKSFGDFPEWWEQNKDRFIDKKIAMFCTGGIRCEKSTNYLLGKGVQDVYHLKGGILKYLENVPEEESTWDGQCFVFDSRVSVGHGLKKGGYELCFACRMPLLPADFDRPEYEHGVTCHKCIDQHSEDRKERFRERQKQVMLAAKRGMQHIGG